MLAVSATDLHPNALAHEIAGEALGRKLKQMALIRARGVEDDVWHRESLLRLQASSRRVELQTDLDAQAAFYSLVEELHPGNIWNMEQLAVTEGRRGHVARAEELYRHLSRAHPDLTGPWVALARLTRGSERRALLEKAVEQVPDEPDSALLVAPLRFREGRQAEGCALVARAARNGRHVGGVREALALGRRHDCDVPERLVLPYPGKVMSNRDR